MNPFREFSVHVAPTEDGGTDVAVFGQIDLATVAPVDRALGEAIAQEGRVVIDLRACDFIDSGGIGVLVKAALRLNEQGRELTIRGAQERVLRIFELAGIASMRGLRVEPQERRVAS